MFVLAVALVLSWTYFTLARAFTKQFIWITGILNILFGIGTAIYYFIRHYYSAAVVFAIFGVFSIVRTFEVCRCCARLLLSECPQTLWCGRLSTFLLSCVLKKKCSLQSLHRYASSHGYLESLSVWSCFSRQWMSPNLSAMFSSSALLVV